VFPINSLEQFLINYCSERLHQFFIESVFKRQQACCRDEGILGRSPATSSFRTTATYLRPLTRRMSACWASCQSWRSRAAFRLAVVRPSQRAVTGGSRRVSYCTSQFREKNMDAVLPEIQQLLLGSSSEIVCRICGLSQGLGEDAQALEQRGSAQSL
ncbi:unnamed protein product, partial [Polarella glacialis]